MRRRDFIRLAGGFMLSQLLPSFTQAKERKRLLRNENKPGFYIRFYKPFEPIDNNKWRLEISGLCGKPTKLTLNDIHKLPSVTQVSRLKCVECWSSKAKWTGFKPEILFELCKPLKTARYIYFHCADDYFEYISIEDLLKPKVLFVHTMNGKPLPPEHGAPLRLIIPFKYGYKSVKTITKLIFLEKGGNGYWSQYGYSADGTIQPGSDYRLDTGEIKEIINPGDPGD